MGLDKYESKYKNCMRGNNFWNHIYIYCNFADEDLIKWGWPEDVWFHVDKVSSAHVYLRLEPVSILEKMLRGGKNTNVLSFLKGQSLDDVSSIVIEEAAQLVKANSIQGNKMNDIDVVYTMWSNLKKTDGMEVGQVGFHKDKEVRNVIKLI